MVDSASATSRASPSGVLKITRVLMSSSSRILLRDGATSMRKPILVPALHANLRVAVALTVSVTVSVGMPGAGI